MQTSVFKEILDYSLSFKKLNGQIPSPDGSGVDSDHRAQLITTQKFKLPRIGDENLQDGGGEADIDGVGVRLGYISPIGYLNVNTIISRGSITLLGSDFSTIIEIRHDVDTAMPYINLRSPNTQDSVIKLLGDLDRPSFFLNKIIFGANTTAHTQDYVIETSMYINDLHGDSLEFETLIANSGISFNTGATYVELNDFYNSWLMDHATLETIASAPSIGLSDWIVTQLTTMGSDYQISHDQWGYLSILDQAFNTTADVTFGSVTAVGGNITTDTSVVGHDVFANGGNIATNGNIISTGEAKGVQLKCDPISIPEASKTNSVGTILFSGANKTITNSLVTTSTIIILTARHLSGSIPTPYIVSQTNGSFVVGSFVVGSIVGATSCYINYLLINPTNP